ncbi:protein SSUH2 homolog [Clarias gariepinus]|uniref:protein SSUH2 homolog n=1 Tax=Clarias gariepinus TaxID=13013 RepID=UPI00234CC841|nr:protein SSUH2 homolog [Clarias gariepinus]
MLNVFFDIHCIVHQEFVPRGQTVPTDFWEGELSYPPVPSAHLPALDNRNITSITAEDAREALISYASSKSCYRSAPARDGVITSLEPFNTYKYRLETFVEMRSTDWSHEPYTGQPVDACIQRAPTLWNIKAQVPAFFKDQTQDIRVPYTSSVKTCHVCIGGGKNQCTLCTGSGEQLCRKCGGAGFSLGLKTCMACAGRGRLYCDRCCGHGSCQCEKCQGKKNLLFFNKLKITWTTDRKECLVKQMSGLNSEILWKVSGRTIFSDSQSKLSPLVGFPDPTINQESDRLIREHQFKYFQTSRILQQRHTIELIPVTKVNYTWKEKPYNYIVFGNENYVYTDNYPATCCCSVM